MANLLIRDIDPTLKLQLTERARTHRHSLSDEAKTLIRRGLAAQPRAVGIGTRLFSMLPDGWRGDDLVFETPRDMPEPAEFA
jgi:plasmid stability protein